MPPIGKDAGGKDATRRDAPARTPERRRRWQGSLGRDARRRLSAFRHYPFATNSP